MCRIHRLHARPERAVPRQSPALNWNNLTERFGSLIRQGSMAALRSGCSQVKSAPTASSRASHQSWHPGVMIDHVSLQVTDVPTSQAFYTAVLAPLGISPGHTDGPAVGFFGPQPGSFWLSPAQRDTDRELHIAFPRPTVTPLMPFTVPRCPLAPRSFMRRGCFPNITSTISVPSSETLTATTSRRYATPRTPEPGR